MRWSVLAFPSKDGAGGIVASGTLMAADRAAVLLSDRVANEHAFPGERVVRLPRRVERGHHDVAIEAARLVGRPPYALGGGGGFPVEGW